MPGKLHVANLSRTADSRNLEVLFAPHGTVISADVVTDPIALSRNTGVARVEMSSDQEATAAMAALNGRLYCGNKLEVTWAAPVNQNDPGDSLRPGSSNVPNATEPYKIGDRGGSASKAGGDGSGMATMIESDADAARRLAARIKTLESQAGNAGSRREPFGGEATPNAKAPLKALLPSAAAHPVVRAAVEVVNAAKDAADAATAAASRAADAAATAAEAAAHASGKPAGEVMSTANRVAEQNAYAANKAADAAAKTAEKATEHARDAEVAASLLVKA